MKSGIIGLPQVGKSSLFKILTKAQVSERANPREAHLGVATVPDDRLDRLAALYNPKKTIHATIQYVDVAAIGQEALKAADYLGNLRQVDSLTHVVRTFDDPSIPHAAGDIDPIRDIKNVEFDLMVSDLGQIEKRLERLEKDLKKMRSADLEKENDLLKRAKAFLETEKPLREMEMTKEDKKLLQRLHVPERETDSVCAEYQREHGSGQRSGRGSDEVWADRDCRKAEHRSDRSVRQGGSGTCRYERRRCCGVPVQL